MEFLLNFAWALCSLALIWYWKRHGVTAPGTRRTQIFALLMVVLLLLPVISLSDDLMAAQGPAEADSAIRRATHLDEHHPSMMPIAFDLPEQIFAPVALPGFSQDILQGLRQVPPQSIPTPYLDSRPPPQA
jgi:hypothetical protein